MRYGLPYLGSKNTIAQWVVNQLPSANTLVDIMAGGCAVTHAALLSGKYQSVIANDITDTAKLFKEVIDGDLDGYATVVDKDAFNTMKTSDPAVGLLYSFANNRIDYLWSEKIAPVKQAASRMLLAPSVHERRMAYRQFVRELTTYVQDTPDGLETVSRLQNLESLERLENMERLDSLQRLQRSTAALQVSQLDYWNVPLPTDCVIYVDPPYKGKRCGSYDGFDYTRFEDWLSTVEPLTIISEYSAPAGCVEVAAHAKQVNAAANSTSHTVERLFVPERQLTVWEELRPVALDV